MRRATAAPTLRALAAALAATAVAGCATTERVPDERDPLEGFNRAVYTFNETFDETLGKPIARGYKAATPEPVDRGVTNFFDNIDDVVIAINNVLQGKPGDAASDLGRFALNSTFGMLGFIDVATPVGLRKHEEDFGQTLGVWGVGSGPYLVLPFLGPNTVRSTAGFVVDINLDLVWDIDDPGARNASLAVKLIDQRADLLQATTIVEEAALDRYAFIRNAYLQRRNFLVHDGDPPLEDDFGEDF
jgi:phospholipid-binding lipoprotein MlaA